MVIQKKVWFWYKYGEPPREGFVPPGVVSDCSARVPRTRNRDSGGFYPQGPCACGSIPPAYFFTLYNIFKPRLFAGVALFQSPHCAAFFLQVGGNLAYTVLCTGRIIAAK